MGQATFRGAVRSDIDPMVAIATRHQADPRFHIPYLPLEADAIRADIEGLDGWETTTAVAELDGEVVGWLLGECDAEVGRLWWWGPYAPPDDWDVIADGLHGAVSASVPVTLEQQEGCIDVRSDALDRWCRRHGLVPETASVLLEAHEPMQAPGSDRVRHLRRADHDRVRELHGRYFSDAHLTPDQLVDEDRDLVLVIEHPEGEVAGFVAVEEQADGSGYIDFVAVDQDRRGLGLGGALVAAATSLLFGNGVRFVHLTVRETNEAARSLYAKLGFVQTRLARPYRRGFSLE